MNNKKTIALASDHAGYPLKEALIRHLNGRGIDTIDCGTNNTDSLRNLKISCQPETCN